MQCLYNAEVMIPLGFHLDIKTFLEIYEAVITCIDLTSCYDPKDFPFIAD